MAYRDEVLADSPQGYWRLGEASGTVANDETANNRDGTYFGSPTLGVAGALVDDPNTAVGFDGTNDKVQVGDFGGSWTALTLEAWVYPTSVDGGCIFRKDSEYDWRLSPTGSPAALYPLFSPLGSGDPVTDDTLDLALAENQNRWWHLAVTLDATADEVRCYRNGQLTKTVTGYTGSIGSGTGPLRIGVVTTFGWFTGRIDEAALYNAVLSGARIQAHYDAGVPPDTEAPAVPRQLFASARDGELRVNWDDNAEADLAGYRLYRDGNPTPIYDGAVSQFTDTGRTNGQSYSYTVSAYDTSDNESAQSAAVTGTPGVAAQTWDARVSIPDTNALWTGLAVADETLFAIYVRSGLVRFRKSTDGGATWATEISTGGSANQLPLERCIAVSPDGQTVHILYARNVNSASNPCSLHYRRSTDGGSTWSAEQTLEDGTAYGNNRFFRLGIDVGAGDKVHVVYTTISDTDYSTPGLFYRRSLDAGVTWAAATEPFPSAVRPTRPDFVADGDTLYVTWMDGRHGPLTSGNIGETYFGRSTDGGDNWAETRITDTGSFPGGNGGSTGSTLRPTFAVDGQDINLIWQLLTASSENLYHRRSTDGGVTWDAERLMEGDIVSSQHSWIERTGDYVVLTFADYSESPAEMSVRVSEDGGATFGPKKIAAPATNEVVITQVHFTPTLAIAAYPDGALGWFTTRSVLPVASGSVSTSAGGTSQVAGSKAVSQSAATFDGGESTVEGQKSGLGSSVTPAAGQTDTAGTKHADGATSTIGGGGSTVQGTTTGTQPSGQANTSGGGASSASGFKGATAAATSVAGGTSATSGFKAAENATSTSGSGATDTTGLKAASGAVSTTGGGSSVVSLPTISHSDRPTFLELENRTTTLMLEDRNRRLEAEDRSVTLALEDRGRTLALEPRTSELALEDRDRRLELEDRTTRLELD